MGQAGAQREPSMEEILASIRRIIENNEPGADAHPVAGSAEAFSRQDAGDESLDEGYADQDTENQRSAANDAPVAQPVSLADVAARARAMPDAHTHTQHDMSPQPVSHSRASVQSQNDAATQSADPEPDFIDAAAERLREALTSEEPVQAAAPRVVAEAPQDVQSVEAQPAKAAPAEEKPAVAADTHASGSGQPVQPEQNQQPEPEQAPEADRNAGGQLVSLQTGEKVAAAFGELDAAIAAGQRRSFDEIAEEMLRPMLTQWLDDNLPTLVERLVREEIERVSRGNRR
ncbi:hypothetical protein SAMN05877838_0122 [Hoeflea halophila]|uniref:Cell pole-organizing protein PopZ n=1 Tax=Hoeflea halophila TaxID=714899 RepID=A0A286HL09_9HYPH|nr:DUF2497 domain-containing protein [Hoeflea halophila]SOE08407.1 hypothetical protein SAMN05877838_0122 [Hoeflea halophila]